jgi:hypothetical protein
MGGATPTDVVWTTLAHPAIVAPRVLHLLETGGFTGWETYVRQGVPRPQR